MPEKHLDPRALSMLTYGVFIVTSRSGEKVNGQISNCVFQVTSEPPRIAAVIHKDNLTHEYIASSGVFAACVLDESIPMEMIGRFGFKSGRDTDKFCDTSCSAGVTGCPLLSDHVLAQLEARVSASLDVGTHTIFVGDVVSGAVIKEGTPLTYAYYQEHRKGKSPDRAPTHRPPQGLGSADFTQEEEVQKYVCDVCGYIYDPELGDPDSGVDPGTAFEDLPDDWVCPVCGAGKDEFSPVN